MQQKEASYLSPGGHTRPCAQSFQGQSLPLLEDDPCPEGRI